MARRITRQVKYVRLPERRIREINDLIASWPYESRAFMRARLNQYRPKTGLGNFLGDAALAFLFPNREKHFEILNDPEVITDWQMRFEISGHRNPQDAWNKILDKEISARDHLLMVALLDSDAGRRFLIDAGLPIRDFERAYLVDLMEQAEGNISAAARSVSMSGPHWDCNSDWWSTSHR